MLGLWILYSKIKWKTGIGPPTQYLSIPKPGHTTGGSGRGGARRGGGAERGRAGRDADGSVRPGNSHPACLPKLPGQRRQLYWTNLRKNEQTNSYVNRWGNKTSTSRAVYVRYIRGTTAALRSWLLTSGQLPICPCKPFSCKVCLGTNNALCQRRHNTLIVGSQIWPA